MSELRTEFRIGGDVHKAVDGVSFALRERECLGLVGESGSGKSVTAMSLLGLVPSPPGQVVDGHVMFGGKDVLEATYEELRQLRGDRMSVVFQDPMSTLHPLITIGDQLIEAIRAHQPLSYRDARRRAEELLALVRIPNPAQRTDAYPHELSGGMRQRICIAMALANDADVLIADEPTTALDVTVQAQVLKLLDRLRGEKRAAVLFITHDFGVVSEICDRIAVMYAGRIVEIGPTADILAAPAHPYTRKLIDCVPIMGEPERRLDAIAGLPPAVNRLPPGCAFADRCSRAKANCRQGEVELRATSTVRAVRCHYPLGADG